APSTRPEGTRPSKEFAAGDIHHNGYGDRAGYEQTDPAVRDAAHAHDALLRVNGRLTGVAGDPVQVRNHDDAGVRTAAGAFCWPGSARGSSAARCRSRRATS